MLHHTTPSSRSVSFPSIPKPAFLFSVFSYVFCFEKTFLRELQHTHLLALEGEPTADKSMDSVKVQLGGPMSFLGVTEKNMGERSLPGAEMTHHRSPPQHRGKLANARTLIQDSQPAHSSSRLERLLQCLG